MRPSRRLAVQLRRRRGELELADAARRARIAPGYLHDLEHGKKRNPGLLVLERLAEAYGCTVGALLEG